jgi:ComF family protein
MFSLRKKQLIESVATLFSPQFCMNCRGTLLESEQFLCFICEHHLAKSNFHRYEQNPLKAKFFGKVPVCDAYAYLRFSRHNAVRKILHALKYGGVPEIGEYFGGKFGWFLRENFDLSHFDCIVPVPLHADKLKRRGYNQSEVIAKGLSASTQILLKTNLLYRNRATETQTKKNAEERYQNMLKVFDITEKPTGLNILLVDDVITTGATLEACALILLKNGCASVSVAALAAGEQ